MLPAIPTPIPMPFAQNGERRAIPETNTTPGSADASWATGFPPVTRINKQAGGKPPYGLDFQGLFHTICEHLFFAQSGNTPPWVGASDGQPGLNYYKAAIVQGSDGETYMALKPSGPDTPNPDGTGMVGPVDPVGNESGHWIALNLLFAGGVNDELWITESGTFTAKWTGWHQVLLIGGGCGAGGDSVHGIQGGPSGTIYSGLVWMEAGEEVPVVIGAGGLGSLTNMGAPERAGGTTTFKTLTSHDYNELAESVGLTPLSDGIRWNGSVQSDFYIGSNTRVSYGGGFGGGHFDPGQVNGRFFGAGGGGSYGSDTSRQRAGDGAQGAVRLRFHNPAKAAGPLPAPALFSARRLSAPAVDAPATVNLYDPETGLGSVWREEDAESVMQEKGLISQEAWQDICAQKAAEEHAIWLSSPDTETERFEMLRAARKMRLAEYDVAVAELRRKERAGADVTAVLAAWDAYAEALCDLPEQEGAPWDGGGEATPWPNAPTLGKVQEEG